MSYRARVFRRPSDFPWPWRVECECGQWQNGKTWRQVFDWTFRHVNSPMPLSNSRETDHRVGIKPR